MLTKVVVSGFLAVTAPMVVPAPALAHVTVGVSVGVFHERLSPYGQWIGIGRYGSCWRPSSVAPEWRPYTVGYWAYGDDGWTWESDEAWGWATYHYGRWFYDPFYGWVWVPGTTWAPAYVAWRYGGDWVGWAPLPPDIDPGYSVDVDRFVAPSSFVFVETRFVADRSWATHIAPAWRSPMLVSATRNVTHYDVHGSHVINRGIDVGVIERAAGRRVAPVTTLGVERLAGMPRPVTPASPVVRAPSEPGHDRVRAQADQRPTIRPFTPAVRQILPVEPRPQRERFQPPPPPRAVNPAPQPVPQASSRNHAMAGPPRAEVATRPALSPPAPRVQAALPRQPTPVPRDRGTHPDGDKTRH
jgi:hypothetical protein